MPCIKNWSVAGWDNRPMATDIFFADTPEQKPVVLYLHGFNGFKDWGNFDRIADAWADAGFILVKFNFSHNGCTLEEPAELVDLEAYGHNNYSIECFDSQRQLDFIFSEDFPLKAQVRKDRVFLLGHSRGGGIALVQAHDERVFGVLTWAAVSALKTPWGNYSAEKMQAWKESGVTYYRNQRTGIDYPLYYQLFEDHSSNLERLDVETHAKALKKPLLIVHGLQDAAVSFEQALKIQSWVPQSELYSVDSDHVFGRKHPALEGPLPEAMQLVLNKSIDFCKEFSR
ncbi:MAG: alpha/beta hydrolase family protein [Chitinophagaceae bacterium]